MVPHLTHPSLVYVISFVALHLKCVRVFARHNEEQPILIDSVPLITHIEKVSTLIRESVQN